MKYVVLTGAGISAESGVRTFRDSNGLWEDHAIEDVASPEGFKRNPKLVLDFYNARRAQLFDVAPNAGHLSLKHLEIMHEVKIITQNVDDLHERAGSSDVLHLHGELRKVRSTDNADTVLTWTKDLNLGDLCAAGHQLRPHIVWFGEMVPLISEASYAVMQADRIIVVGSSMQVYPAAGLVAFAAPEVPIWYVDPFPQINAELKQRNNLKIVAENAASALPKLVYQFLNE